MHQIGSIVRRLLRQPAFAAAAIGTLALGIAASSTLFTVVNATLLRPLPYVRAGDIYAVRTTMTDGRFTIGLVASEEMATLRRTIDAIDGSALVQRTDDTLVTDTESRQIAGYAVSEGFFELFGLPMAQGRLFAPNEYVSQGTRSAVLSDHAWRTLFGGSPDVVGRTIHLASGSVLIVGIAPPAFDLPHSADLWWASRISATPDIGHTFDAYVRFKPGLTPASIQAPMARMFADLAHTYPDMERNRTFVMRPLLSATVGDLGPIAIIAFAAASLLLLLAVVNVANLSLARGAARTRELAVRTALGATRWRLAREAMGESLVIAAAAAGVGLALSYGAVRLIVSIGGASLPRVEGLRLEPAVFLFVAGVMVLAGVLIGLMPALMTANVQITEVVNEGGRSALHGHTTRRFLGAMIVAEVTLAIALVAGAGRLALSVDHLMAVDPGFTAAGRLAIDVTLPSRQYSDPAKVAAWSQQVEEKLRGLGATDVGMASSLPLRHEWDSTAFVDIVDRPTPPEARPNGRIRIVSPGFFDVMHIPIVAGRGFTTDDRGDGAPVVLVNQAWVRKFIPGLDPLREQVHGLIAVRVGDKFVDSHDAIVGVVKDVLYADLTHDPEPIVYLADAQRSTWRRSYVITTADGHPERLVPEIQAAIRSIDPSIPVDTELMSHALSTSLLWPSLGLLLTSTFGVAALVLAVTGVFGVIAFVVAQRTGEMAVRLALGATRGSVFGLVMRYSGWLAAQGVVFGVLIAWWTGRLMGRYVYHVAAANWMILAGSAVVVLIAAFVATVPPARKAATVTPASVLRS